MRPRTRRAVGLGVPFAMAARRIAPRGHISARERISRGVAIHEGQTRKAGLCGDILRDSGAALMAARALAPARRKTQKARARRGKAGWRAMKSPAQLAGLADLDYDCN